MRRYDMTFGSLKQTKSILLKSVDENINSDSVRSIRLFGSAMTSVIASGETIDEKTKVRRSFRAFSCV